MRRRASQVTVLDMFCGAGGSSLGARAAGADLRLAMNHWDLAVEVHNANFPDALHACCDISATDPRRFRHAAGLGAIDVLVASPECTWWSQSNPKAKMLASLSAFDAAAAERSRATAWDVPRYAEVFDFAAVVVENVIELTRWPMYPAWLHAMACLGYTWQELSLNASIFGVPQSRDRLFVVFWKAGDTAPDLDFAPPAFCQYCETTTTARQAFNRPGVTAGKWQAQYRYVCATCGHEVTPAQTPAATVIDFDVPATPIRARDRRLAAGTMARIHAGVGRYPDAAGLLVPVDYNKKPDSKRARPISDVLATQTARLTTGLFRPPDGHPTFAAAGPLAVQDCSFRMLEPIEVGRGMAFPDDYRMAGSRRARTRLYGNACVPPVMEQILGRVIHTLQPA